MNEFLLELKVFFGFGKWYKVFPTVDDAIRTIPDKKSVLVHVGSTEICLARNGNQIKAFINECPHHQMPLNKGTFNMLDEWICPYHRHCFEMRQGRNITMPSTKNLKLYYVKTSKRGVFVFSS